MANDLDRKWVLQVTPTNRGKVRYEIEEWGTLNQAMELAHAFVESACYEIDCVTLTKANNDSRED